VILYHRVLARIKEVICACMHVKILTISSFSQIWEKFCLKITAASPFYKYILSTAYCLNRRTALQRTIVAECAGDERS
jgi:hypothetical protein